MLWETKQSRAWEREDQKCGAEASFHFKEVRVGLIEKRTFQQRITGSEGVSPSVSQEDHLRQSPKAGVHGCVLARRQGTRGRRSQRDTDTPTPQVEGWWKRSAGA